MQRFTLAALALAACGFGSPAFGQTATAAPATQPASTARPVVVDPATAAAPATTAEPWQRLLRDLTDRRDDQLEQAAQEHDTALASAVAQARQADKPDQFEQARQPIQVRYQMKQQQIEANYMLELSRLARKEDAQVQKVLAAQPPRTTAYRMARLERDRERDGNATLGTPAGTAAPATAKPVTPAASATPAVPAPAAPSRAPAGETVRRTVPAAQQQRLAEIDAQIAAEKASHANRIESLQEAQRNALRGGTGSDLAKRIGEQISQEHARHGQRLAQLQKERAAAGGQ